MKNWAILLLTIIILAGTGANSWLYFRQTTIIENYGARIIALQADAINIEDQITSLTGTIQTINGNVSGLSASVNNLETDIVSVKEGITRLNETVQSLNESTSSLSGLVNSLQQYQSSGLLAEFTTAVDKVKPAVVVIEVEKVTTIFPGRRVIQQVVASGWVINSNGIIVTNNHVIADATSIKVILADGRTFPALAVQTDTATDLAVVKIDARDLPVVMIGDSDALQVGQPVAAIGNALGLGINMSGGWVSRLNTLITFSDGSSLSGLIGTDAAINPGNSGGPLVTSAGEVVGITNAKLVQTGVEGIGFAISINNALKTINSLIARL